MKYASKFVLLAKVESEYGVDAAPDATNLVICSDPDYGVEARNLQRNYSRPTMTPLLPYVGGAIQRLGFGAELVGGGLNVSTLQAPRVDPLLQACGMVKTSVVHLQVDTVTDFAVGDTVTGGTSSATGSVRRVLDETPKVLVLESVTGTFQDEEAVTNSGSGNAVVQGQPVDALEYRPTSDRESMESSTLYYWRDGIKHALLGCRGSFSLNLAAGEFGALQFAISGLYAAPTDTSMPSLADPGLLPPIVENIGLMLGSYVPAAQQFGFDLAANVVQQPNVNKPEGVGGLDITSRAPVGSCNPEADTLAAFNPWSEWRAGSSVDMVAKLGTAPGNRIRMDFPKVGYTNVTYTDREGVLAYDIPLAFSGAGDDEIILTFS